MSKHEVLNLLMAGCCNLFELEVVFYEGLVLLDYVAKLRLMNSELQQRLSGRDSQ